MDDRRKLAQDSLKNAKSAGVKIIAGNYFFNLGDPPNNITTDKCLDWAKKFYDVFKAVNPNDVDTLANDIIKGWCMKDEPTYEQMTDSSPNAYNLRTMVNYMIDNDNTRPIQINLVGGKSYKHMGDHSFESYLNAFQDYGLNLWSYDLYPITEKSCLISSSCTLEDNCMLEVKYDGFYGDLEIFSKRARDNGGVFWSCIQTMEFISTTNEWHPAATEASLRFWIFSTLAFGAQGIVYWTYLQRADSGGEIYLSALIDRHRQKTPAWYYAQRVNAEVRRYKEVFVNCQLKGYWHVKEIYAGCPTSIPTGSPLISASVEDSSAGCLISLLQKGTHRYLVVVSHDIENYQTVTLTFRSGVRVKFLTPSKSGGEGDSTFRTPVGSVSRELIPGGYIIMEYA